MSWVKSLLRLDHYGLNSCQVFLDAASGGGACSGIGCLLPNACPSTWRRSPDFSGGRSWIDSLWIELVLRPLVRRERARSQGGWWHHGSAGIPVEQKMKQFNEETKSQATGTSLNVGQLTRQTAKDTSSWTGGRRPKHRALPRSRVRLNFDDANGKFQVACCDVALQGYAVLAGYAVFTSCGGRLGADLGRHGSTLVLRASTQRRQRSAGCLCLLALHRRDVTSSLSPSLCFLLHWTVLLPRAQDRCTRPCAARSTGSHVPPLVRHVGFESAAVSVSASLETCAKPCSCSSYFDGLRVLLRCVRRRVPAFRCETLPERACRFLQVLSLLCCTTGHESCARTQEVDRTKKAAGASSQG